VIRLIIADDHPVVREGIRRILSQAPDMTVIAEAENTDTLLSLLAGTPADVVLLDIGMPGAGFLPTLRQIKETHPSTRVVVLSVYPEEQYATRAFANGASGYLTKDRSPDQLIDAIRRVQQGGRYVSPELADRLVGQLESARAGPPHTRLSEREYEVLCLLGQGHRIVTIAQRLNLSSKTVSTYRSRVLSKLGLHTNADLVRYVLEHGLKL
jgi:DNA-binding NarL/FixJ family response regulator